MSLSSYSPAYHNLCALLTSQRAEAVISTLNPADWDDMTALAIREQATPLLYYCLKASRGLAYCPPTIAQTLKDDYYAATAQYLRVAEEIRRVLTALTSGPLPPIRAVLLKGAVLAAILYPIPSLRPMIDIDILVAADSLFDARQRLYSLGFEDAQPDMRTTTLESPAYHLPPLIGGKTTQITVELHWNLVASRNSRYSPDVAWFWTQIEPLPSTTDLNIGSAQAAAGRPLFMLTPTANLLHLCAHLMLQHLEGTAPLRWYYDIHLLLTQQGQRVDWQEFVCQAQEFRWAAAAHAALGATNSRFGTPLPEEVLAALAQVSDAQAARLVIQGAQPQSNWTATMRYFSSLTWAGRFKLIKTALFPSPRYMRWRYGPSPSWLWPLYYPYRWLHALGEGMMATIAEGQREGDQNKPKPQ